MMAFLMGVLFGAIFMGSAFLAFMTRPRKSKRREPLPWQEETYTLTPQQPVTTRVIIQKRVFDI